MFVIMFHSVGLEKSNWPWRWLSVSRTHFENICRYIAENRYTTYHLDEWYTYTGSTSKKDPKKLVLTFDDGYLDNWIYVYPILKKYGLKGTVFINPDFVDPGVDIRPNMDEFCDQNNSTIQVTGFLNWAEIKKMDQSDHMDIQSHSMTHDFLFFSDKIKDIYSGQDEYLWLPWIYNRPNKYNYMSNSHDKALFGSPVFEYDRALRVRKYIPDPRFIEKSQSYFSEQKRDFMKYGDSEKSYDIKMLKSLHYKYSGHFECEVETRERYIMELAGSKKLIEEKLKKSIKYLCWPGGGYNELSLKISEECGYIASTLGSSPAKQNVTKNRDYKRIDRFGLSSFQKVGNEWIYMNQPDYLISNMKARTGNYPLRVKMKMIKEWNKRFSNINTKYSD